jgi:hypothetical protein
MEHIDMHWTRYVKDDLVLRLPEAQRDVELLLDMFPDYVITCNYFYLQRGLSENKSHAIPKLRFCSDHTETIILTGDIRHSISIFGAQNGQESESEERWPGPFWDDTIYGSISCYSWGNSLG